MYSIEDQEQRERVSGIYCDPSCKYADHKKHRCKKYSRQFAYCKQSGCLSFTVHERCDRCREDMVRQYAEGGEINVSEGHKG